MYKSICTFALFAATTAAQGAEWESFGDWQVKAMHDQMDTVTHVALMTSFADDKGKHDLRVGFDMFGRHLVTLITSVGFIGDSYWPECDFNLSSVSVDGRKAVWLTPESDPGECNRVSKNGDAIKQLLNGKNAKLRLGHNDGRVSLTGFKQAWARALSLSRR
jgi:hypothetical protein